MSVKITEFNETMESIAPLEYLEEWDNHGFQIRTKDTFSAALVTLDITPEVVKEAVSKKCDLVIAHHPIIFSATSYINDQKIIDLIQAGISVYTAHTNFDAAPGGNNDYLAKLLNLVDITEMGITKIGKLSEPKDMAEVNKDIMRILNTDTRISGSEKDKKIQKIMLCTGGAGEYVDLAINEGCDLYLTGEARYHEALKAYENDIIMIEAGHYGTEQIFRENLGEKLRDTLGNKLRIEVSEINTNPFISML